MAYYIIADCCIVEGSTIDRGCWSCPTDGSLAVGQRSGEILDSSGLVSAYIGFPNALWALSCFILEGDDNLMVAIGEVEGHFCISTRSNLQGLLLSIDYEVGCYFACKSLACGIGGSWSGETEFAFIVVNVGGCSRSIARSILDEGALQVLIVRHIAYECALTGLVVDCVDIRLSFITISDGTRYNPINGAGSGVGDCGFGVRIASEGDVEVDYLLNAGVGLADLVEFLRVVGDAVELAGFVKEESLYEDLVNLAHFCSGLCLKVNLHERTIRAVSIPVHLPPEDEVGLACCLIEGGHLT